MRKNSKLFGFIVGASEDGYIYHRKDKNEYGLEVEQVSYKWLVYLQRALKIIFNKNTKIRKVKGKYYRLNVYSKEIYLILLKFHKHPRLILKENKAFQIGFLQGIFDAEGSVSLNSNHIRVSSKNLQLIRIIRKLLKNFNFRIAKLYKDKNNVITLSLYGRDNLLKFYRCIGFNHPIKQKRLKNKISCRSL